MAGTQEWAPIETADRYRWLDGQLYARKPVPPKHNVSMFRPTDQKMLDTGEPSDAPVRLDLVPRAVATPVESWVERISKDCASFSSTRGIRSHRLYASILANGKGALAGVLRALDKAPKTATIIAFDIVGKDESPIRPEDYGILSRQIERWKQWGYENNYLK